MANWKLKYPGLEIQADTRKVLVAGKEIEVTPREFDLLYYLAQNPGGVLQRQTAGGRLGIVITSAISVPLMFIFAG